MAGVLALAACGSSTATQDATRAPHISATKPPSTQPTVASTTTQPTNPVFATGPYAVNTEDVEWTDASRATPANHGAAGHGGRKLPTRIYLPTTDTGAPIPGLLPMFLWVHGLDATVEYFDPLLREWAARGYVVVAPTFPLTHTGAPGGPKFDDYVNQPADVSYVISQVLAEDGPQGAHHPGLIDPTRIAVGGHSLGAATTIGLTANQCCIDTRVRAAVEIDGKSLAFSGAGPKERAVPVLMIHGNADTTFDVSESRSHYAAALPPKFLVILRGIPHTPFRIPAARAVIVAAVGDFLDAYLEQQPGSLNRLATDVAASPIAALTSDL